MISTNPKYALVVAQAPKDASGEFDKAMLKLSRSQGIPRRKKHTDGAKALASKRFFAVLEIPPVKSAADAVRASIVADAKGKK